jgi:hypothetical protein
MCRKCDNSSSEWTERDEREVEIARGDVVKSLDKVINILEKNEKIINDLNSDVDKLSEEFKKL